MERQDWSHPVKCLGNDPKRWERCAVSHNCAGAKGLQIGRGRALEEVDDSVSTMLKEMLTYEVKHQLENGFEAIWELGVKYIEQQLRPATLNVQVEICPEVKHAA